METRTYTVYKFKELPDAAKEKALERYRNLNVEFVDWSEFVTDSFKEKAENMGFEVKAMPFSGFWSQGDGARIEVSKVDWQILAKTDKDFKRLTWLDKIGILHGQTYLNGYGHHSCHEKGQYFRIESDTEGNHNYPKINAYVKECEAAIEKILNQMGREYYFGLQKEFEYLTSDEVLIECFESNDYFFTENGEID